jgi:hypothetical protein
MRQQSKLNRRPRQERSWIPHGSSSGSPADCSSATSQVTPWQTIPWEEINVGGKAAGGGDHQPETNGSSLNHAPTMAAVLAVDTNGA